MAQPTHVSEEAYSQGVSFTAEEWREMMQDPCYFGYSCPMGHALREDDPAVIANGCMTCFMLGESQYDMWDSEAGEPDPKAQKEFDRWVKTFQDFPVIRCGNCKSTHVGVGGVRRCYDGRKVHR